jgi:NADH dehydrogenase (ubiquinone) Fe-S protein 6
MLRRTIQGLARRVPARSLASSTPAVPVETQEASPTVPATFQAPNAPSTWSTNQLPRPGPASSPRFEQTSMELQPNPLSAMALVNDVPPTMVDGRRAVCDGGALFGISRDHLLMLLYRWWAFGSSQDIHQPGLASQSIARNPNS